MDFAVILKIVVFWLMFSSPVALFCQDTQARAEAMLQRAREASDIRAPNAPPFTLTVEFSYVDQDLDTIKGTYTELWLSKSKWRRETIAGEFHRIEIGGMNKRWLLDSGKDVPEQALRLPALVGVSQLISANYKFDSIKDPATGDPDIACTVTVAEPHKRQYGFCFHKPSGVLIQTIEPYTLGRRTTNYSCGYGSFRRFGKIAFPWEMACFLETHRKLEAKLIELKPAQTFDPALFIPSPEALKLDTCLGTMKPPKAISSRDPVMPSNARGSSSTMLWIIVDLAGKPQNLRIARSGGKAFDEQALRAVRKWRFQPASCDGHPIAAQISIEVNFTLF